MNLPLTKTAETTTTITLTWTPPTGAQWYTFYIEGVRVSNAPPADKNGVAKTTVKFAAGANQYQVVALCQAEGVFSLAVGTWDKTPPPPPPPPPVGRVDGIGIVRYGGSLANTSHLDSYDLVISDWTSANQLSKLPGLTFAYRNLGPPGYNPINLTNPTGFVTEVQALVAANPGLDGVFLDNCAEKDRASQLPFIKTVGPPLKAAGIKVMLNAVAQDPGQNDGTGDARWYGIVGPYATHLMSELWMQGRGGPLLYKLRLRGGATYSDYWDEWLKLPKAAHDTGCAFVGMTYGTLDKGVYGRASQLLVAQPGDVFCWNPDNVPEGTDPYNTVWMKNMGSPVDVVGTNPRRFANGVASVNPVAGTATLPS